MSLNQSIEQWLRASTEDFHAGAEQAGRPARPHVTLCYAQSWDGSITTSHGETLALSGPESLKLTHQIRSLHDGILVGIGTVLADDPRLNVREWPGTDPQPIVLDSLGRMPPSCRLCLNRERPCWALTTPEALSPRHDCEQIAVPANPDGQVDLHQALQSLHARGIRSLMVEGGASVITAFLHERLADAVVLTVAPILVGGLKAVGEHSEPLTLPFPRIAPLHNAALGDDLIVWGNLNYHEAAS